MKWTALLAAGFVSLGPVAAHATPRSLPFTYPNETLSKGEVEVEDAEIAGVIDGTLLARGNLIVRATGKVLGTARCRRLQVEDGGQITGRIEMLTDGVPPRPADPVPVPPAPAPAPVG